MWYFVWMIGLGFAVAVTAMFAIWLEGCGLPGDK